MLASVLKVMLRIWIVMVLAAWCEPVVHMSIHASVTSLHASPVIAVPHAYIHSRTVCSTHNEFQGRGAMLRREIQD